MQAFTRFFLFLLLFIVTAIAGRTQSASPTRVSSFDGGWRFIKANPAGADQPGYDDSRWRTLDLPHDWSIEDLPDPTKDSIAGPFSKASISKMGTGYTIGGTAWYRKSFTINDADKGKTAYLQFDGVYMNADVWINGKHVGNHPYGFTSFGYDITPYLNKTGQPNTVAVQVKNEGLNARWYSGSGIYRHTWLTLVNPVHILTWGMYVTTPVVSAQKASVEVATHISNSGKKDLAVTCVVKIISPSGAEVGRATIPSLVKAGQSTEVRQLVALQNPALWSLEKANLYRAEAELLVNDKMEDRLSTAFGIRSIHFDGQNGFTLNGKTIKLKGGCFHHDNGPLGAAAIDRAEERKIEILKKAGFNAIRCSHNPPSPYLLDVCDRLGMLVIDEAFDMWEQSKMEMMTSFFGSGSTSDITDYSQYFKGWWQKDLQSMLLRDRNHPAIIMWSIGNEIREAADSAGLRIATDLVAEVKEYDKTRAITEAHVDMGAVMGGESTWEKRAPHLALLDVIGYNYGYGRYRDDHNKYPERIMYASEFMPSLSLQNWQAVQELPYVIGNFTWTAMDYIGEAGTGVPRLNDIKPKDAKPNPMAEMMQFFQFESWPMVINFQGDIDLIGNPKVPYYYQHVVWGELPLSLFVHRPIPAGKKEITSPFGFPDEMKSWNWEGHRGEIMTVHVYTRGKQVQLELNGKIIAKKTVADSSITASFEVAYEPGTLTARCFDKGAETGSETIKTVGPPTAIRLLADRSILRADRNDLSYVMVEIVDAAGNVVPDADGILVDFEISGNGEIAGVGNGNHSDLSGFQQPHKKTWQGKCLAIVRPKGAAGKIVLTAKAEGLKSADAVIFTK
jgi:beta-galactosidase